MAHWINSEPQEKPQRRKWNLQDRSSLKNLKFHIAEDGCSEDRRPYVLNENSIFLHAPVQYDLARQLLEENSEAGEQANHSLGVHWLMRAADQGHKNALEMLSECFRTRRGIDDRNECEVQSFLDMSAGERAARKAARELFACLSNGEEYITAAQLERKMREIYKIQKNRWKRTESDDHELSSSSNGHISPSPFHYRRNDIYGSSHTITEAHLVSAASHYSNGNMPSVSQALTLSVPHPQALDHIPCFHRLIFHPILFFVLCYHRFIKSMAAFPESTMSNLNFLVLLLVYAFCASDSVTLLVPMGLYYLSLVVMIIASFKMLKTKHDFIDFRMWSGLFLSYSDNNFNVNASENQFLRNNMKPYLYFFVAFFGNVMLNPIIADQWLPHSEITVVSFTLVFITMFAFMYSSSGPCPDWLILVSFGINMLAKYPYEMDTVVTTGWRFLDLKVPNFPSFVVGNGIEFCLNCRALLYLLIPGVLLLLARRKNWHGTYRYLIPHCVTLSWLQICLISSQCATMFGLVRAALGLAGLLLFLPLFGIVTLMIPVFAAVEWLSLTDPTVRIVASICTAAFAVIGSCLMAANRRTEKYVTVLQIMVCVVATAFLTLPYMTSNFESSHSQPSIYDTLIGHKSTINHHHHTQETTPKLSWDLYYKYCNLPAWEHVNKIDTQVRCSHLDGSIIKWKGTVLNVEISRVTNVRANLIKNYLPTFWADLITCWYGERNKIRCNESEECNGMQHFFEDQKKCNLNNWNVYDYDIVVRMTSGMFDKPADVLLKASHSFGNFTGKVKAFDKIWFKGILINNHNTEKESEFMTLGKERPLISLTAIGCIKCEATDIETFQIVDSPTVNGRVQDLYRGIKYLLNVLFNPLVTFK